MKELDLLLKNIKNKELLPIYFLHGVEPYYIDQVVKVLENEVLEEDEKAFNQTVIYGKETSYSEVLSLARQYPMMGDKQMIIVKEAQDLRLSEEQDVPALLEYALNPVPSTIIVFAHKNKKLDGRKTALVKALKPYLFLSEEVKDYDLPKFIIGEMNSLGLKYSPNIANLLAEYLGNDLSRVFNELNKVKMLMKPNDILNESLVERYIGISKEYNSFELQNAIASKNEAKAFQIASVMGKNEGNHKLVGIVAVLFSYFQKLLIYHTIQKEPQNVIASELSIHPYFIKDYRESARLYPIKHTTRVITILREFDMKSKGFGVHQTPDSELLKELIYKIIHVDKTKVKI